jgi:hypothetical protein
MGSGKGVFGKKALGKRKEMSSRLEILKAGARSIW